MILVLGATGNTGGEVARQLIAAGVRPRLLVRDRAKAREFEGNADIVTGDLTDRASLDAAMRGVEKVYLVATGLDMLALERNVIEAAKAAGVVHVVRLSVIGADAPTLTVSHWHTAAEQQLMASGLAWTMLRPGNFMTNALDWGRSIRTEGNFHQPTGDGRWAMIDPADIAAVAVAALTVPGHAGKAYAMTGPDSMDGAGYAKLLTRVLDRPVAFVDVPAEAAQAGMLENGLPPAYVDALLDLLAAMKAGHIDGVVTGELERVTGRKAGTFEAWARRNAAALGGTASAGAAAA